MTKKGSRAAKPRGAALGKARFSLVKGNARVRSSGPARVRRSPLVKQIIRLRQQSGLSQSMLAKKMGITQPAVAKLESGRVTNLELRTLERTAEALNASLTITLKPRAGGGQGIKTPTATSKKGSRRRRRTSPTGKPPASRS